MRREVSSFRISIAIAFRFDHALRPRGGFDNAICFDYVVRPTWEVPIADRGPKADRDTVKGHLPVSGRERRYNLAPASAAAEMDRGSELNRDVQYAWLDS